ncbi:MAG: cell division protein ZipA C-terminal FtsZ-binding domain-containing protein, partial [Pseudomonadota bacterium]
MDELRIILIALGVLLVVGIYLADRMRRRRAARPPRDWHEIDQVNEAAISELDHLRTEEEAVNPDEWVGQAFTARRDDTLDEYQLDELKGLGDEDSDSPAATREPSPGDTAEPAPAEDVIVLTLLAPKNKKLRGPLLLKALQECGLRHGDMDIFHYHVEGRDTPLFSVANVLEPGRFILSEMAQLETPGVALFMQLPAVIPGT